MDQGSVSAHQGIDHLAGVCQIILLKGLQTALITGLGQRGIDGQLCQQRNAVSLSRLGSMALAEDCLLYTSRCV